LGAEVQKVRLTEESGIGVEKFRVSSYPGSLLIGVSAHSHLDDSYPLGVYHSSISWRSLSLYPHYMLSSMSVGCRECGSLWNTLLVGRPRHWIVNILSGGIVVLTMVPFHTCLNVHNIYSTTCSSVRGRLPNRFSITTNLRKSAWAGRRNLVAVQDSGREGVEGTQIERGRPSRLE
jgi:hypothetical protein